MMKFSIVVILLICFLLFSTGSAANAETIQFDKKIIDDLRNVTRLAEDPAFNRPIEPISPYGMNYSRALEPYHHLRLRDNYRLFGVYAVDGLGSYSIPFVLPVNESFSLKYLNEIPAGEDIPPQSPRASTSRYLSVPVSAKNEPAFVALPEHADQKFLKYFIGDDSPESYLEASVLCRELPALDADWHAQIGWPIEEIIDYNQTPSVTLNETHALVRITAELGYCGSTKIQQYVDLYTRPSVNPISDKVLISSYKGGKTEMSHICF